MSTTLLLGAYTTTHDIDSWHLGCGVAKVCSSTFPLFIGEKLSTDAQYLRRCCCANEERPSVARQSA